jgi:uncharacterized protein (AIM24 family)
MYSTSIDVITLPVLPDGKISILELGAVGSDETDCNKQRFYLCSERVNLAVNLPGKLADEALLKARSPISFKIKNRPSRGEIKLMKSKFTCGAFV